MKTTTITLYRCTIFTLVLLFLRIHGFGQNEEASQPESSLSRHSLGIMIGYAWIPQAVEEAGNTAIQVIPTLGLDYSYRFSEKLAFGMVNDIEFDRYIVENREGLDIQRENKYIGAFVAIYEVNHFFAVYGGPGIEIDSHENFALIKLGLEIGKKFEEGWSVAFNTSIDINELYQTISAGIIVAKRFPSR